jgi:hypothetical protein
MYLDGRTPVTIVFPARIRGQLREDRLRHALARVQAKHPLLRCLIVQDDGAQDDGVREQGRPWFQLQENAPPIPLRIVERKTDQDCEQETRREWTQLFDANRDPLIRMTWLRGPETSELLLVCHHCICDGSSIVALLREILLLCERPGQDIGTHASLESLEEILPDEVRHDSRLRRRIRWKAGLFKLFIRTRRPGPVLGYGPVYATRWTLDRPATQVLAQRCKAEGVTVFNALCVAFVLAFRAVRGARSVGKFTVPVDVRRFLPALRADSLFAMAPTVALSLRTPRPEAEHAISDPEFWVLARALKADMDRKIDRLGPSVHENLLGMERLHALFDKLIAYGQSRPSGGNVTLSWLGRLELPQDYGDFRLEAVHSPTAMLAPTPANLITISGFDGSLDFALTSDEQSLPVAQAQAVKDKAMQALRASSRAEPSPPLRAPALALAQGRSSACEPVARKQASSPRGERGYSAPEIGS